MPRSDQYKAFRRRYSYLRDTLNPSSFAPRAFDVGLLSKSERSAAQCDWPTEKKNDTILEAVERRILANCSAFDKLLQVLQDIENEDIVKELEESLEEVRNAGTGRSPARTPPPPSRTPPPTSRTPPPPSRTPPPQPYGGITQSGAVSYSSVQPPPDQSYTSFAEPSPVPPPASLRGTNTWHTGHTHTSMHPPPRGLTNYTSYAPSDVPHPPPAGLEGYVSSEGYTNPAFRPTSAGAISYTQSTGYTDPAFHHSSASAGATNYTQPIRYQHSASDPHLSLGGANYAQSTGYPHSSSNPSHSLGGANYAQPTGSHQSAFHQVTPSGGANYAQGAGYTPLTVPGHPFMAYQPSDTQYPPSNTAPTTPAPTPPPTGAGVATAYQLSDTHHPPLSAAHPGVGQSHELSHAHLSSAALPYTSPPTAYQPSDVHPPPSSAAPTVPAPTPLPTGAGVAMAYQPSGTHHPPPSSAAAITAASTSHPTGAGVEPSHVYPSSGALPYTLPPSAYQPSGAPHPPSSAAPTVPAPTSPPTGVAAPVPSHVHTSSTTLPYTSLPTAYQPSDAPHPPSSAVHTVPARASHPAVAEVEAYRPSHVHHSTAALPYASPPTVYQPLDAHHPPSNVAPIIRPTGVAASTLSHIHPSAALPNTPPPITEPISQPPTGPLSWEPSTGGVIAQATPSLQPAHAPLSNVQEGRQEDPFTAGVQESGGNQETHAPVQETQPGVSEPQARAEEPRPHVSEARAGVHEAGGSGVQEAHPQAAVEETKQPEDASRGPVVGLDRAWFQNDGVMGQLVIDGGEELGVIRFAAYKNSESKKCKAVSLSFESVKVKRKKKDEYNPYPMKCSPHGIAIIINNEQFVGSGLSKRTGTAVDEENLVQTFRYLRYNVELYRNCTSAQVLEIFRKVQERDHTMYDSFVCCILTHGDQGIVYGSDGRSIKLSKVAEKLEARNCASLANKPKMFFIQACRGTIKDPAASRVTTDGPEGRPQPLVTDGGGNKLAIPNQADFLFSYATPLGHVAIRHTDFGSWYISELCHALCHSSTYLRLKDMLTDAHNEVGDHYYYKQSETNPAEHVECRQACEFTSRLRRNVYFF